MKSTCENCVLKVYKNINCTFIGKREMLKNIHPLTYDTKVNK